MVPRLSFAKTPSGGQVVDLLALIQRHSQPDDHPPAPPASTPPLPLRRPSPARPREPCLAPPARRVQEDGAPAEASHDGSLLLLKRFVKSTARGSFQLLLSLLLLDENDRRACGRARCARFVILLFALSVASGDSPAHDG